MATNPRQSSPPLASHSALARLRKAKAALLAVCLTFAGVLLIMLSGWLAKLNLGEELGWLHALPLSELGGTLFGAGLLGTLFEYTFRKEQEEAAAARFRAIIHDEAPALRDAVINGFAIHKADLARVATPELLDDIAANAMALRLGDEQFARELYGDIRDQAIHAAERWHDVEARIRLSNALESSTSGTTLLDVTVEWEYITTPSHPVRRFACVSERAEYNELRRDIPATSTWFMTARDGMNAASREFYELLELTVDGRKQPIQRSERKTGQFYSVYLDEQARSGNKVRIRQIFRTMTPAWGHRLFFELPQPARNFSLMVDYTETSIAYANIVDTVAATAPAQVLRMPESARGRTIKVELPGWLLPSAGFAFNWTLDRELPQVRSESGAAGPRRNAENGAKTST